MGSLAEEVEALQNVANGLQEPPREHAVQPHVQRHYFNSSPDAGKLYVAIRSRNIPTKYYGAGRIIQPQTAAQRKLPPIPDSVLPTNRGYDMTSVYPGGHIAVPGNSATQDVVLELANGGGCGTPANILLNPLNIWPQQEV